MIETGLSAVDQRVDYCYRLFLGREVDTPQLYVERAELPIDQLVDAAIASAEFDIALREPLAAALPGLPDRYAGRPEPALLRWVCREMPIPAERVREVRAVQSWPHLLDLLFGEPAFVAMLAGTAEKHAAFRASLTNWNIAYPASANQEDRFLPTRDLHIVVPLYRQPHLLPGLFDALIAAAEEITQILGTVVLVNDSPDDEGLRHALGEQVPGLAAAVELRTLTNEANLGFVGACNRAMRQAHAEGADVLLLNSDALVTPGALREMRIVAASDPMISVVSPRSNNATICNSPVPDRFRTLPIDRAHAAHLAIQPHLPRVGYVPVGVGFCLLIRYEMIDEFGVFDPIYGAGYNEENDFILRCNQRGYRAVLANHAFVLHIGSVSFEGSAIAPSDRDAANRAILLSRYPEYPRSVERYFNGVEHRAERLLAGLIPEPSGKPRILFDARHIAPHHNGTFELARHMIAQFVGLHHHEFDIYIACSHQALSFHGFDRITWLSFCWDREVEMAPFAAVVRLAQPFGLPDMAATLSLAPIGCYLMLDTIALDCQQLDTQDLATIWSSMVETSTSLGFISAFSAAQFNRRFAVPANVTQFVALCSTRVEDYGAQGDAADPAGEHILIVGNHYPHKQVQGMLDELREVAGRQSIVVLGTTLPPMPGVTYLDAGELDQPVVDDLYDRASVVLFPSFYEGFGLPIMHALARRKPIVCRDLPATREIAARTRFGHNIRLCGSTREMARIVADPVPWQPARPSGLAEQTWHAAAATLGEVLRRDLAAFDYRACVDRVRRLERLPTRPAAVLAPAPIVVPAIDLTPRVAVLKAFAGGNTDLVMDDQRSVVLATAGVIGCQDILLDAARGLHLGGTLYLDIDLGEPRGAVMPRDVLLWLVGFGFTVVRFEAETGSVVAVVRKVQDWSAALALADLTDAMFVEHLYHDLLDRAPDAAGAAHYVELLSGGMPRERIVRIFHCSAERHQHVASLIQAPSGARAPAARPRALATAGRRERASIPKLRDFVGKFLLDVAKRRA